MRPSQFSFILSVVLCAGLLTALNVSVLLAMRNPAVFPFAGVSAAGSLLLFFAALLLFLLHQKEAIVREIRLLLLFGAGSFRAFAPIPREVAPLLGVSLLLSFVGTLLLL